MLTPHIPNSFDELTSEWITDALGRAGHLGPGKAVVNDIEVIGTESGFASEIGRIHLTYDPPNSKLPSSMIAKLPDVSTDATRVQLLEDKYEREAAFYSNVWPDVGCRTPACYYVAYEPEPSRFILLMEDLGAARFGDAAAGWSFPDATLVVEALASMHAKWWNTPGLDEWTWLRRFGDAKTQFDKLLQRRSTFLERYGKDLSRDLRNLTMHVGHDHADLINTLGGRPRTLLHIDTHLDNVAFLDAEDSTELVLFDWQGVGKGLGVVDLSSFLTGGSTEQRRQYERGLIERYHAVLVASGVTGYSLEMLNTDYSRALFRWWVGTVNGLGSSYAAAWTGRQAELARQSVERWNAISEDHGLTRIVESGA